MIPFSVRLNCLRKYLFAVIICTFAIPFSKLHAEVGIVIRGDQEAPTVLYLVPWKKVPSSQGNTDFDLDLELDLLPLSRSEAIREVRYYRQLNYDRDRAIQQRSEANTRGRP